MGESGTEGQGEGAQAKPVPEGAAHESEGSVSSEGVQAFRGESVRAPGLDLLVDADEPEQVIIELQRLAKARPHSERWEIVVQVCRHGIEQFEHFNQARRGGG